MPATGACLAKAFGGQVHAPPPKPATDAPPQELAAWQRARKQQSSQRICVEHANAEHKQWRALQRWIGRREYYAQTHLAIAAALPQAGVPCAAGPTSRAGHATTG